MTLTAGEGSMRNLYGPSVTFPDAYSFRWQRVDADGSNPVDVGTDFHEYTLVDADGDQKIRVEVTFTAGGGNSSMRESNLYPPGAGTVTPALPDPVDAPVDWVLTPSGLREGDEFRLLFISSRYRDGTSTGIWTYNTFIRDRAAAGHAGIQAYSSGFRVVGCTPDTDARDNTRTTYTVDDKGVPIYWLGPEGNRVADDYEDFYDGGWDDEVGPTNEFGAVGLPRYFPRTGCDRDGTKSFHSGGDRLALGDGWSENGIIEALEEHILVDAPHHSPLAGNSSNSTPPRNMYGLSQVFVARFGPVQLALSPESLSVGEAGTGTFTVKLSRQPSGAVTVTVTSDDTGAATVTPGSLTFTTTNWNTTQTVTVRGVDDSDISSESVTVTASAAGGGSAGETSTVSVTVRDNDDHHLRSILVPYDLELGEKALPEEEINVWAGYPFYQDMYVVAEGDRWSPSGVWADPAQNMIWVVDPIHFGIHALKLSALKEGRIERHIAADTNEFDYRFNYNCHFKQNRASGSHGNPALTVMWGDGNTIWVVNDERGQLDAYRRNGTLTSGCYTDNVTAWPASGTAETERENFKTPFTRDASKDYLLPEAGYGRLHVRGIWGNSTTIWLSGPPGGVYTLDLSDGQVAEAPGFNGHNGGTNGLWSDGTTMWVATPGWLRAYNLNSGVRRAERDVGLHGNLEPDGMWSDGETIWITYRSGRIEAYRLPGTSGGSSTLRAAEADPLTAHFALAPEAHDGENGFKLRIVFSDDVEITPEDMRDHALLVSGGTVTDAARVKGR